MGEDAVNTALDHSTVFFLHLIVSGTLPVIQRAVTEQAVELFKSLVARIVFTLLIGKELT